MREAGASKLKPIITLVIYWKGDEWSYATTLHEMFDETAKEFLEKTGIISHLPDYSMNLFIPKAATEEELGRFETDLKYVMTYVRYSDDKNKLMNYARENNIVLNIESVTIINMLTNSNLKIEEGKDEVHMCKALDDLIEDGRNEGRNEGWANSLVNHVMKCMDNTGASLEMALKILGETMEDYLRAKSIVEQETVYV